MPAPIPLSKLHDAMIIISASRNEAYHQYITSSYPLPAVNIDNSSNQITLAVAISPQTVHSTMCFYLNKTMP